jgi:hypothetical protein
MVWPNIKQVYWGLLILSLVSLIPLLVITGYVHPSGDDFTYGRWAVHTWRESGSLLQTLAAAVEGTKSVYHSWQGSFVGVFLMVVNPAVFGDHLYKYGLIAVIIGFITATMFLLKVIFMDYLKADKYSYGVISLTTTFFSVHFMVSPSAGLFWYNSGMYYTGFHSLSLVMFALILKYMKTVKRRAAYTVGISLLAFLIGAGNYVTALVTLVTVGIIVAYTLLIKRDKWLAPAIGMASLCVSFVISAIAPGNVVRNAPLVGMSAVPAVLHSFTYGVMFFYYTAVRFSLLLILVLTPLIYKVMKKYVSENNAFRFRYPVLVIALFYGVYASTFTPNLYTWATFGPTRVMNINLFALSFFMLLSVVYMSGYIAQKKESFRILAWADHLLTRPTLSRALTIACACVLLTLPFFSINRIAGVSAAYSLITGQARVFHEENLVRRQQLEDPSLEHLEVPAFTNRPHVIFYAEFISDPNRWPNDSAADYYNKQSVIIAAPPEE